MRETDHQTDIRELDIMVVNGSQLTRPRAAIVTDSNTGTVTDFELLHEYENVKA